MSDPHASAEPAQAPTPSAQADPSGAASWTPPGDVRWWRRRGLAGEVEFVRRGGWRRVVGYIVIGFLVVVLVAAFVAAHTQINDYVITPGQASPVSQYISVPPAYRHPLTGKILLTDVYVTQLNALNYLQYRFFDSDSEIYPGSELLGGAPTEGQFLNQGYLQMAQAQNFATAAALTHLGYHVSSSNAGALVYGIPAKSPAAATLKVAEVIEAVDAKPTPTVCALTKALHGYEPGTSVTLRVEESTINDEGAVVPGKTMDKAVTLGTPPKGINDPSCGGTPTAYLGVLAQTQQDWHFPVAITINTPQIGGPSAGVAMTLGIIDKMSGGKLTGRHVIAATGTMDQNGTIGDVGGVAEKTIAVERAHATVFFVPTVEYATAESKATPQLHVYGVNNLGQVLRDLERLGGSVPSHPVPAQAAP
jgi:Lon-like protease